MTLPVGTVMAGKVNLKSRWTRLGSILGLAGLVALWMRTLPLVVTVPPPVLAVP
jgi:hypothetical protein